MHMSEALLRTAAISAVSALALVGLVRRLALRHGVLDHPTQRSSHAVATPRGGGLGLVLAVLGVSAWRGTHPVRGTLLLLLVAVSAIALVGWLDDRRGLSVRARLVVHVMAGAAVGATAATSSTTAADAFLLFAGWTFWTVSSINLVNFMDGINGLVASQIAVFALSLACFPDQGNVAVGRRDERRRSMSRISSVELSARAHLSRRRRLGRARIRRPDARSSRDAGAGNRHRTRPPATSAAVRRRDVDDLRRWRNGERLTAPHRSHLYQRLANDGLGHTAVTAMYTVAAVCGALAAHMSGDEWVSPWTLSYASLTLIAGFVLHRRATGGRRVAL